MRSGKERRMTSGKSKDEQFRETQRALLDVARELFTENGYAATSTEEVVQRAGVTRGALYYHYKDKIDLFRAVFDEVRGETALFIQQNMQAAQDDGADLWQQTLLGFRLFVERAASPSMQRIVYLDGSAILDWHSVRKRGQAVTLLYKTLERLMAEGFIERMPLDPLVQLIRGNLYEAGFYIANAENKSVAQAEMLTTLTRVLVGLQPGKIAPAPV